MKREVVALAHVQMDAMFDLLLRCFWLLEVAYFLKVVLPSMASSRFSCTGVMLHGLTMTRSQAVRFVVFVRQPATVGSPGVLTAVRASPA